MKKQPIQFTTRKAVASDLMFFYEAIKLQVLHIKNIESFNELYKKKLKDKNTLLLILESDKKMAGFVVAQLQQSLSDLAPYYDIRELFIAPPYRKLKAADFIYTALEQKIAIKGVVKLKVSCNINSTLNQNFYINKGFKIYKKQYVKGV